MKYFYFLLLFSVISAWKILISVLSVFEEGVVTCGDTSFPIDDSVEELIYLCDAMQDCVEVLV